MSHSIITSSGGQYQDMSLLAVGKSTNFRLGGHLECYKEISYCTCVKVTQQVSGVITHNARKQLSWSRLIQCRKLPVVTCELVAPALVLQVPPLSNKSHVQHRRTTGRVLVGGRESVLIPHALPVRSSVVSHKRNTFQSQFSPSAISPSGLVPSA